MDNNTFQPDRFVKLIARKWNDNPRALLLSIVVFAGLPLFFFLFNTINIGIHVDSGTRTRLLVLLTSAAFIFSPFALFYNYNHPKKGLSEAMLPASMLEKYIVMQLVCILLAPLTVFVLYGVMDSLLAFLFPKVFSGYAVQEVFKNGINWISLSLLFSIQQAILFCNLLFVRRKLLKTAGVFVLYSIIASAIIVGITATFASQWLDAANMAEFDFGISSRGIFEIYKGDHPLIRMILIFRIIMQIVLPAALVIGSFFVMKKKKY